MTSKTCAQCDSSCKTCNGGASNKCLSCYPNFFLFNGTCVSSCPDYTSNYSVATTCSTCHSQCLKCSGSSSSQCTQCPAGRFLSGSSCVSSCPQGTYQDTNSVCQTCLAPCQYCNDLTTTSCTQCLGAYRQTPDCQCRLGYTSSGDSSSDCTFSACPAGYFKNSSNLCQRKLE